MTKNLTCVCDQIARNDPASLFEAVQVVRNRYEGCSDNRYFDVHQEEQERNTAITVSLVIAGSRLLWSLPEGQEMKTPSFEVGGRFA